MTVPMITLVIFIIQTMIIGISAYFVLRQLQKYDQNLHHDAYSKAVDYYMKTNELMLEHPKLVKFFNPMYTELTELEDDQKQFYLYLTLFLGFMERLYQLYQIHWIDQKTWEAWERWLLEVVLPLDTFRLVWKLEKTYFNEDFRKYVDHKLKTSLNITNQVHKDEKNTN